MLKPENLYSATNGGLDIILAYYPDAINSIKDTKKPFKIRNESTASCFLREFSGIWKVTDFGDDGRARSAIDICMLEDSLTFSEALYSLADRYQVASGINSEVNRATFEKRAATDEEPEGHFAFELNEAFTEFELKVLGPRVKEEHCKKYEYHSVKWYSKTKNRVTTKISSNEHYPIFMRECPYEKDGKKHSFKKIYQPLNSDKAYRFFYIGEKPAEYINGLMELEKAFNAIEQKAFKEHEEGKARGLIKEDAEYKPPKIEEAIICSGERDALCAASFGYFPIWFNSETYKLSENEYKKINRCVERLYNIPDIDLTGIKKGTQLALDFIDIFTIWLPSWLKDYKDMRGKPRKDLRDYVELRGTMMDFKNLLKMAMPCRFWEYRVNNRGYNYEINTEYMYHFLRLNGFGTIEDKSSKTGYMYVSVTGNVVKQIELIDIKRFLRQFVKKRHLGIEIINLVNNSSRIGETTMAALDRLELDFTDFDRYRQFLFFENKTWEITAHEIKEHKPGTILKNVWEERVIPRKVKRTNQAFSVTINPDAYDITFNHTDSNFFKYLVNTSRVHWRKEMDERCPPDQRDEYFKTNHFIINGPLLQIDEVYEQKLHLINKIFTMGYLLHRYKAPNRAWCVYNMDNKIGEDGDSNGRSGKTFFMKGPRMFKKTVVISGRNPKVADNPHLYDRVTEYTDFVLVDDAYDYFPFQILFDKVTGDFEVNPKNNQSYEIPFEKAPKIGITTNFILRDNDPSTEGRLLYCVFSDWYHVKTDNNDYQETRSIHDDFGKNLFMEDYTEDEWNADLNFFADCVKFYLSTIDMKFENGDDVKIQPPMRVVSQRRLKAIMGAAFESWALSFFDKDGENVNCLIKREDAFKDYATTTNAKNATPNAFLKRLKAFCHTAGYIRRLNPDEYKNTEGRITRKVDGKTYEMLYIQTTEELDVTLITEKKDGQFPF